MIGRGRFLGRSEETKRGEGDLKRELVVLKSKLLCLRLTTVGIKYKSKSSGRKEPEKFVVASRPVENLSR